MWGTEKTDTENSHSLIYSQIATETRAVQHIKFGAKNDIQVSHMAARNQTAWALRQPPRIRTGGNLDSAASARDQASTTMCFLFILPSILNAPSAISYFYYLLTMCVHQNINCPLFGSLTFVPIVSEFINNTL